MKKHTKTTKVRRDFLMPDALWAEVAPLIPRSARPHRFGGGRPRVDGRRAVDAIFFVLRTGCQWNSLRETGLCSSSTAHRRFQEWREAGVFAALWKRCLKRYDALKGIDWSWLSVDGAMTKAPLSGEKMRPQPHGQG
jgi:putative transposase